MDLYDPGKNHFAPRVGFAYQLDSKGDLVVRGNFGAYYDQINLNPFLDFRPPLVGASQGIQGNPFGNSPVSTYSTPFCGTLASGGYQWDAVQQAVCPLGYTNAGAANSTKSIFPAAQGCSNVNCTGSGDPQGLGIYSVGKNFRVPYFFNYSLQVEKGFGNIGVWQVGYVGSEGRKLNIVSNINQNGAFPQFGPVLQLNTVGTSNYNALQTTFRMRSWHGVSTQVAYTWAHALDEISEYRAVILDNAFNRRADYGNGDYDTRNLFTIGLTYDVPKAAWATGWKGYFVNGWQVSSILNLHSGQPYDETLSGLNQIGQPFAGVSHGFDPSLPGVQWLNPNSFCNPSDPACKGFPVSRNKYPGPNFKDWDLSVIKYVPITERFKFQLRADMFNLTNRKNYSQGVGAVGLSCGEVPGTGHCSTNAGFGQVSDTAGDFAGAPGLGPGEPFNMQLAIKLIF